MFVGAIPRPVVAQALSVVNLAGVRDVYVCCSGSFRLEQALAIKHPDIRVHSNDVSLISCALGQLAVGRPLDFKFKDRLEFLERAVEQGEPIDRLAALGVALKLGTYTGKSAHAKAHFSHYEAHAAGYIAQGRKKLEGYIPRLHLASFTGCDFKVHARVGLNEGATIFAWPPTYKCLIQSHRLLTADLLWVPCGDLKVGDRLLTFEEQLPKGQRARRYRYATVTNSEPRLVPVVRVHLANGETITCTPDHPWLADLGDYSGHRRWVTTDRLVGKYVLRALDTWATADGYEAGWLAGMFDGEGCVAIGTAAKLGISQKTGDVADLVHARLQALGFRTEAYRNHDDGVRNHSIVGGFPEILKALGTLRPGRLMKNFAECDIERQSTIKRYESPRVRVDRVEPAGEQWIQSVATTTGTYIGEGYLMHNSGYENLYKLINHNTEWQNEPSYDIFDPATLGDWLTELDEASAPYVVCADHELAGRKASAIYAPGRARRIYLYTSMGKAASFRRDIVTSTPFRYRVVDPWTLTPASKIEIRVADVRSMNYIKDRYLAPGLAHADGDFRCLVYLDGALAGGWIYRQDTMKPLSSIYLLCDFSTSRERKVSKLIAMLATGQDTVKHWEAKKFVRIKTLCTTAFSKKPVSMKYRGIWDLQGRKTDFLNYQSEVRRVSNEEIYRDWWKRYGKSAVRGSASDPGGGAGSGGPDGAAAD